MSPFRKIFPDSSVFPCREAHAVKRFAVRLGLVAPVLREGEPVLANVAVAPFDEHRVESVFERERRRSEPDETTPAVGRSAQEGHFLNHTRIYQTLFGG